MLVCSAPALLFFLHGAAALRTKAVLALAPEASFSVECGEACSCPSRCSGNGECFAGKCKCFPGYTYYDCSLRAWPRPPPFPSLAQRMLTNGSLGAQACVRATAQITASATTRHATAIRVGKVATAPSNHAPTSATITAAATRESACAGRAGVAMHARRALARTSAAGKAPVSTSSASADSGSPASIVPHLLARAIAAAKDRAITVPPPPPPHPTHRSARARTNTT